jgi:hypothetical protein
VRRSTVVVIATLVLIGLAAGLYASGPKYMAEFNECRDQQGKIVPRGCGIHLR